MLWTHFRFHRDLRSSQGMYKFDPLGAEALVGVAELCGIAQALLCAVLGVAQDGAAQVGAVQAQLVGTAGQRLQLHQGVTVKALQHPVAGLRGLAGGTDAAEQTGQGTAVDGGIDDARAFGKTAENLRLVGLF